MHASRCSTLLVLAVLAACEGSSANDESPAPTDLEPTPDERACEDAIDRAATECPPLSTLTILERGRDHHVQPPSIVELDRIASEVPGGLYVPVSPSISDHDAVGYVLADNAECQVSCIVECDVSGHALCMSLHSERPSCSFCGASATLQACERFVAACE